ncbi:hypothetical protein CF326_g4464 [Tilletia indica]|nr:hypothetical protein CF326_g4464 [Tilletia indica]
MKSDLRRFCASCGVCQVSSRPQPDQEREYAVVVADTAIQPFEQWGVDLIGKLPSTPDGNRCIVTAVDYATGWTLARALPDAKVERIAEFIYDEIFLNFGAPRDFITDNGENLLTEVVEALMPHSSWFMGSSPGYQESIPGRGFTRVSCEPADAVDRLPRLRSAREQARERSHARALKNKSQRDERVRPHALAVGSLVLVRNENATKFEAKWFGPYRITALKELDTYALETVNGHAVRALLHGNRLRPAQARGQLEWWHNPDHRGRVNLGDVGVLEVPTADATQRLESQVDAEYDRVPEMRGRPRRRVPSASPSANPVSPASTQ